MKNKMHAHTHTYNHMLMYTHTHTRMHTKTHACTRACARVPTRTKYSFVIGCQSLWNHLPHTAKETGSNSVSRYLKRSYLVNLSKYRLVSAFITVPLTLFDLFVVKYGAKCPISSYKTSVLHELCMERSEK